MEQFSLEKWLQDKSRIIRTRDGRSVRIVCTDVISHFPIVAAIKLEVGNEFIKEYDLRGRASLSNADDCDLFFADDEEELTEFDYAVLSIISDHNSHTDSIEAFAKRSSKKLLDLARKEILKDLPKWKRSNSFFNSGNKFELGKTSLRRFDGYEIPYSELEKLPKEE